MNKLLIIVGSVRPGRVGLLVAKWVRETADGGWDVDFADLAELNLPFMDEPQHPSKRAYTKQHTLDWSARVDAADAIIMVTPEYNHSYSPALKNAIDYLSQEWFRKPVGFVSYGGVAGGTRGVTALEPVLWMFGMVNAGSPVEIPFVAKQVADGEFAPTDRQVEALRNQLANLAGLAPALRPLQNR